MNITKEDIGEVLDGIIKSSDNELFDTPGPELEKRYYHFKWDDSKSVEYNTYKFFDLLNLYSSFCRRWETHHNGYVCVVERVRDQYLYPKIKDFLEMIKDKVN